MLKRIAIENYRSCLRTSLDLNPNLSVLIGPNGSGKTNILQAIMLLNKMASGERHIRQGPESIMGSSTIKAVFQQGSSQVQLRAAVDTDTDESNNDIVRGSRQRWLLKSRNGKTASFSHPALSWRASVRRRTGSIPAWETRALDSVAVFCQGIKYYGASQFTNPSLCPVSFEMEGDGNVLRPIRPRGHARLLYDMYAASKAESTERYCQFVDIVGPNGLQLISELTFREVPTSSIDHSVKVGGKIEKRQRDKLLVIPQFRIGNQTLSPNQLSEGTFKTLALLFHLIASDSTVLLIEEPEVCIHHGLLGSILELIKSYAGQKQMILSTHSDYVLDHVAPENVFRITYDKSLGTVARPISKIMTAREFSALRRYLESEGNLGEFWREGGLGDEP